MNEAQLAWPLISIVGSLAGIVVAVVAVMKLNRRQPPLAEDVAKNYALRAELDEEVKELNCRIDREIRMILSANVEQSKKLDALIATTGQTARDIALGNNNTDIASLLGSR